MPKEIATLEASLAEAKGKAEQAGGSDENLNKAVEDAQKALDDAKAATPPAPSQGPKKKPFTRLQRLRFERQRIEDQIAEEEGGSPVSDDDDDNKPLTRGDLKRIQAKEATQSAVQMAESSIEDETERAEVIDFLQNRITPSGDAKKDLATARGAVNGLKNAQLAEEAYRSNSPARHPAAPGNPGKGEEQFTPTAQELTLMRPPYNATKDDIIRARQKEAASRQ